ncbi:MAG: hypothetical protein JNL67_13390 [Planctomycetaceae bacterium]|nr:hypothetical protein [Planctomycetaceae bacterium]
MSELPWAFQQIEPTTWAYVSSLLMLALFFKFSRLWSMRNLDLTLLVLLAPGLLLYNSGVSLERRAAAELAGLGHPISLSLTSGGLLENQSPAPNRLPGDKLMAPTGPFDPAKSEQPASSAASNERADDSTQTQKVPPTEPTSVDAPPTSKELDSSTPDDANQPQVRVTDPATEPGLSPDGPGLVSDDPNQDAKKLWLARRTLSHSFLYAGFLFMLVVGLLFVVRLFLDQLLVRRPALETNLSLGGLWLLVVSLLSFLVANIMVSSPTRTDVSGAQSAAELLEVGKSSTPMAEQEMGPAYPLLHLLPVIPTMLRDANSRLGMNAVELQVQRNASMIWVAKLMAILSQFAIVAGLVWMGGMHFSSWQNGAGMATIYLMLPYTVQMSGAVDHVLPGALLLWAVVLYRHPFWAGLLFGLTMGLVYYPIFLLALWLSFYWERGVMKYLAGVGVTVLLMIVSLLLFSTEDRTFVQNLQGMFGVWLPRVSGLKGIWEFGWDPWFRLPILVAFVSLGTSMVAWPIRKTFGTLMAYNAALLVAVQFWHGYGGGLFMAWYLPLTIATFFRPAVHERIARHMVS